MAAEIGLLSMTQIQNLSPQSHQHQNQPQPNPSHHHTTISSWMWNPKEVQQGEEDDSWEVRAFAEDTMDTTWPPRSYTCTFCRREFRSAQALGGHMNVHRRDRARLHHHHQPHYPPSGSPIPTSPPSFINIPPQELVGNGGLCFLYHLPSPNVPPFPTHTLNACGESPSSLLSAVSSYPPNNFMVMPTSFDLDKAAGINGFSSYSSSSKVEEEPTNSSTNQAPQEELDLELRLGHRSTPSS